MKAEELVKLIRNKYESRNGGYNQCVVLEQVPDGTGMHQGRWIDAAVFQMWESKGLTRSAFEIKVSRHDFLNELQHPEKHQWCYECFHQFWFVAPKDVIQIEELPIGAGWMYPRGKQLCIARMAANNRTPKLDDVLLAAFMRAAYKEIQQSRKVVIKEILDNDSGYQDAKAVAKGVELFLEKRGLRTYLHDLTDPQVVVGQLEQATMDKELKADSQYLLDHLNSFQHQMQELFSAFAVIAHRTLLEKDEMGRYLLNSFGGNDRYALEVLKDRVTNNYGERDKQFCEILGNILNWGKE